MKEVVRLVKGVSVVKDPEAHFLIDAIYPSSIPLDSVASFDV